MSVDAGTSAAQEDPQLSLSTAAARNLTTTTKTVPQMQGITSRWLLRLLPWVQVSGGTYRVNRRLTYAVGGGRVPVAQTADAVTVVPPGLREIPVFAGFADDDVLTAVAGAFEQREVDAGSVIAESGQPVSEFYVVAHGKVARAGSGAFDFDTALGVVADGGYLGTEALTGDAAGHPAGDPVWDHTLTAATACTLLVLSREQFQAIVARSEPLQAQLAGVQEAAAKPQNKRGEADIAIASGHNGEPALPGTFAGYELNPREYELAVAQTVLRVHTRVADLFSERRVPRALMQAGMASVIVNDLHSVAREAADELPDSNLVLLIAAEENCPIREATERTVNLHNDFVRAFEASQAELAAVPSVELQRFLRGAQAWMAGGFEWHSTSDRYK